MASTLFSEKPSRGLDVSWPGLSSQGQVLEPDDLLERLVNGQITGLWPGDGFIPSCASSSSMSRGSGV